MGVEFVSVIYGLQFTMYDLRCTISDKPYIVNCKP